MHIIQEEIGLPKIKALKTGTKHAIIEVGPLPTGYGMTLGNALRRVIISSVPGACIAAIKVEGISHEYSTVPGCKESILDITLNLKGVEIEKTTKEPTIVKLNVSKEGVVTAKDIEVTSDIKILNPEAYITTLDKGGKLSMELHIEKGVGYVPANARQKSNETANLILMDAIYSPIKKVRFDVEPTRVGQMTNLDKLVFEIETNGSITPENAIKFAANILQSYFSLFNEEATTVEEDFMSDYKTIIQKQKEEEKKKPDQEAYTPIEILGFSPRTLNALINGGIGSIEQLTKCTETKLANLRGFGKKALNEVKDALEKKGFKLADEE